MRGATLARKRRVTTSTHNILIQRIARCCAVFSLLLSACQPTADNTSQVETLTIHVAASLYDVIQDLGSAFSQRHHCSIEYNIAGSGALAQQIMAAPRGDLYISANQQWMETTVQSGTVAAESVTRLLTNHLALVAAKSLSFSINKPEDLCRANLPYLCIGDPNHVPAGMYAQAWLQSIPCGSHTAWKEFEGKVLPAIDVRAALAQTQSVHASMGIVYYTDYLAQRANLKLLYKVPPTEAPPIAYYGAVLQHADSPEIAQAFLHFFHSDEAQTIIARYGFGLPKPKEGKEKP